MRDIHCLESSCEHVRVMAAGMGVFHSVQVIVNTQCCIVFKCGNLHSAVFITDANIGFVVSSVVLWVFSVVLTVTGPVTMAIRKGKVCILFASYEI